MTTECQVQYQQDPVQGQHSDLHGHIVSADGMRPDPRKVEAIVNMPRPSDKQGLLRLLGMIKYLAQYIPNESSITAPLRSLLKQDVEWSWQPEHDVAMQLVRQTLVQDTVLTFYDVYKPATIQADASQSGLIGMRVEAARPARSVRIESIDRGRAQLQLN